MWGFTFDTRIGSIPVGGVSFLAFTKPPTTGRVAPLLPWLLGNLGPVLGPHTEARARFGPSHRKQGPIWALTQKPGPVSGPHTEARARFGPSHRSQGPIWALTQKGPIWALTQKPGPVLGPHTLLNTAFELRTAAELRVD